jgi:flagellar motor switch protein FliN/FliY
MLTNSAQTIESVLATSRAGAAEAAAALERTFGFAVEATVGEPGTLQSLAGQLRLGHAGLVIVIKIQGEAALITLSADILLPKWCIVPDSTSQNKLATLAQELGMNLYPDEWMPEDFVTHWVPNLSDAMKRGGVSPDGAALPITLTQDGQSVGSMGLVWPASRPDQIVPSKPPVKPAKAPPAAAESRRKVVNARDLPSYTKTLLRITVPVVVTLARKRQALSRILELSPGSIIQFDKPCEDMLDLMIGNRPVAVGEAVKVGDKFGLRVTSISSPEERFHPATPRELKP